MNVSLTLARKYRPQRFSEVIGQETAVKTLQNAIKKNRIASAYLFSGSKGTGKTSLARLLAKTLNCLDRNEAEPCNKCLCCKEITANSSLDVIEIDGASNRGIDDIRRINETAIYSPSSFYKIYIIDEVHMLTKEAFNALLKTLEEPPEKVKFLFATTEPHKILSTITSRCQRFDLKRIPIQKITEKLSSIVSDLQRDCELKALEKIASYAQGSLRDAESLLDQILCYEEGKVTLSTVEEALGMIPQTFLFELDEALQRGDFCFCFTLVEKVYEAGKDFGHLVEELLEHFRNLLYFKMKKQKAPSPYAESLEIYTQEELLFLLELLINYRHKMQTTPQGKTEIELLLFRILQVKKRLPLDAIAQKLLTLEEKMRKEPLASFPEKEEKPAFTPKEEPSLEKIELKPIPFSLRAPLQNKKPDELLSLLPEPKKTAAPLDNKSLARFETLVRFASVELDGFVKKP